MSMKNRSTLQNPFQSTEQATLSTTNEETIPRAFTSAKQVSFFIVRLYVSDRFPLKYTFCKRRIPFNLHIMYVVVYYVMYSQPSKQPTQQPTMEPTGQPTMRPSRQPTSHPSCQPSDIPTQQPTNQPWSRPSRFLFYFVIVPAL